VTFEIVSSTERFRGPIFSVVTDEIVMPDGGTAKRDYMRHMGAAAVVALDAEGFVVMIRQYRHPVGKVIWELPAGLLDVAAEDPMVAAARELAEECDLVAAHWRPLVTVDPSPGVSNERIHIFLARGLSDASQPHRRSHEEAQIEVHRVPLAQAVRMALTGEITNSSCVAGVLAAHQVVGAGSADDLPERRA
jgi:ADP-ribose pyrophosphatase